MNSAPGRRSVDLAARREAIVREARAMAEVKGWAAVTSRSLSAALGFTQPVLYRALGSMPAVQRAVAEAGFVELAAALRGEERLERLAATYLGYADANPATYDAMFRSAGSMGFATPAASGAMRESFAAIERVVGGASRAEVAWAALHGMTDLESAARMDVSARGARLAAWVDAFS